MKIQIVGRVGEGTTSVARAIELFLRDQGFEVENVDPELDVKIELDESKGFAGIPLWGLRPENVGKITIEPVSLRRNMKNP